MTSIKISNPYSIDSISISNTFIDYYMPPANGEFVKVYLYLLRAANSSYSPTIADMADALSHTESDILRALKYWEKQGLFALIFDETNELKTISLLPIEQANHSHKPVRTVETGSRITFAKEEVKPSGDVIRMPMPMPQYDPKVVEEAINASDDDEMNLLMYEAESLFGVVPKSMTTTLFYLYNDLGMSSDLIAFAIEHCAEAGKKNEKYFRKMTLGWYNDGIKTRAEAKQMLGDRSEATQAVMKALGLNSWGDEARVSLSVWQKDYNMPLNLIVEACNRAYSATGGKNALKYAQKVIEAWNSKDVHTIEDLKDYDALYQATKKHNARASMSPSKKAFNNYDHGEGVDYDALLSN